MKLKLYAKFCTTRRKFYQGRVHLGNGVLISIKNFILKLNNEEEQTSVRL